MTGDNYRCGPGQCNLTNALSVNAVERSFPVFLYDGRFFSSCSVSELVVGGCKRQGKCAPVRKAQYGAHVRNLEQGDTPPVNERAWRARCRGSFGR